MAFGGSITAAFKYMEIRLAEDRFRGVGKAALGGPFDLVRRTTPARSVVYLLACSLAVLILRNRASEKCAGCCTGRPGRTSVF